jgi:hypothetical protein
MVLFSAIMLAPALVVRDAMQCAVSYNLSRFVTGSIGVGPFALAARCRNRMSGPLSIVLWLGLVLIGIAAMQWGRTRG